MNIRAAVLLLAAAGCRAGSLPAGFQPVFNGKDLTGWHISRMNHHGKTGLWTVENGVLVARQNPAGEGGILLTDKTYGDIEVYLEIKPAWGCDGGLFLRSDEEGRAYQIMIDYLPGGSVSGLNGEGIPLERGRRALRREQWQKHWKRDDWNTLRARITGEAPHIEVWLNGEPVFEYQDGSNHATAQRRQGMLAVQMHFSNRTTNRWRAGGEHLFRNVGVKTLGDARDTARADSRAQLEAGQSPAGTNDIGMEFVSIPAGSFVMGRFTPACAPARKEVSESEHEDCLKAAARDTRPGVLVKISRPFQLGKHEVTQQQWERVMGRNPSYHRGPGSAGLPVDSVSWADAQKFLKKLDSLEPGSRYRLPTEAEWEYAARAGLAGERHEERLQDLAWFNGNSGHQTYPVGGKPPNAWGLHDMYGNVWEWCQDWYSPLPLSAPAIDPRGPARGEMRVLRGGSALSHEKNLRPDVHAGRKSADLDTGLRVVREAR